MHLPALRWQSLSLLLSSNVYSSMRATYNGILLAESDDTINIEGNHYFPRESLVEAQFESSDHTSVCPWKGTANYLHVLTPEGRNDNAAWYYPSTKHAAKPIEGRVAFWRGVEVGE